MRKTRRGVDVGKEGARKGEIEGVRDIETATEGGS